MEIIPILIAIKRRWYLFVFIPTLISFLAYLFTRELKNEFKSTAQLSTGITLNNNLSLNVQRQSVLDINLQFNNLIQNLSSTTVISLVSYKLAIHDLESNNRPFRPEELAELKKQIKDQDFFKEAVTIYKSNLENFKILETSNTATVPYMNILKSLGYDVNSLRDNIRIFRVGVSDYLNVSYVSEDALLSAFVVNTLCDEFLRYQIETMESSTNESIRFFESIVEDKKNKLDQKSMDLSAFKKVNNLLDFEAESRSKITRDEQLQLAKLEENRNIRSLNTELEIIKERISEMEQSSNTASSSNLNVEIINVRNKINDLNTRYINSGQQEQILLDSINYYRSVYRTLTERQNLRTGGVTENANLGILRQRKNDIEMQLKISNANLVEIDNRINSSKFNASDYATKESKLQELTRERDLAADEYLRFQQKLNEVRNSSLMAGNSIQVVLRGQPAESPEKSKKLLLIAMGFIGSFGLILFSIVITEILNFSIKNPYRFKNQVGLNLIGLLTKINKKRISISEIFKQNDKEYSIYIEYLRKVRYELEAFQGKVILATSTKSGQGKSFFLRAIAHSLSNINKRVLIIDMNFKSNLLTRQHIHLNEGKNMGLISRKNILQAGSNCLRDFVSPTPRKNVYFIGCEVSGDSPFEIFNGASIKESLLELKSEFDFIFIESAALNEYSDTKELEGFADFIISIVSAESTVNQLDRESFKYFESLNSKFFGCILNFVSPLNLKQL